MAIMLPPVMTLERMVVKERLHQAHFQTGTDSRSHAENVAGAHDTIPTGLFRRVRQNLATVTGSFAHSLVDAQMLLCDKAVARPVVFKDCGWSSFAKSSTNKTSKRTAWLWGLSECS